MGTSRKAGRRAAFRAWPGALTAALLLASANLGAQEGAPGAIAGAAPGAPPEMPLIAVSADIVEISGSLETQVGFGWNQLLEFDEVQVPGILQVGNFNRKTALATTLRLLETEGRAQILSNPKVIVKSNEQASFVVGGDLPFPTVNNQGVGVEFKKFGVILNVLPFAVPGKKDSIQATLQIEVSNPDFSKPVTIQNTAVPSMQTRQMQTVVELKSGETLVLGGLKQSTKNVSVTRIPVLGRIPLLGALFKTSDVTDSQSSLYLFLTMEELK